MKEDSQRKARLAKQASYITAAAPARKRNLALASLLQGLRANRKKIISQNAKDLRAAQRAGLALPLLKRLELSEEKFSEILREVSGVKRQQDPLGRVISKTLLDTGLELSQVTTPLGVVLAIFESRPDALVQISCLAIKTGNCAILKGGSEAKNTNRILAKIIRASLRKGGLPQEAIQLVESRESVKVLLTMNDCIDLVIPRGGSGFVRHMQKNSTIPLLAHSGGICHEYVDLHADLRKAVKICVDAKCQYPAACNAMETLLVHKKIAEKFLSAYAKALGGKVELRADAQARKILRAGGIGSRKATENDWKSEYNGPILSIKTVKSLDEAIAHINKYGSKHTDGIITENAAAAREFLSRIDSAGVYLNCSTRFADGYRYGKGAEAGISTGKLHARGPSGAEALLTYKYTLKGSGQIVADYSGKKAKKFLHKKIG